MVKESKLCRNCKGDLVDYIDLGEIYPSNFVTDNVELNEKIPLVIAGCTNCRLLQLKYTVDLDLMYRQYWYKSGINKEMVEHLKDIVDSVLKIVDLDSEDIVVDIGCNDGTLLSFYPENIIKVGFDPAYNLAESAKNNCDYFINNYFSSENYPLSFKAKVVTAIAMIYDLEKPNEFINDVMDILSEDGIFVVQFADIVSMILSNDFPTICHEHIEYYDLYVIKKMLEKWGLRLFKVERNKVNGGSLRLYLDKGIREVDSSVNEQLKYESEVYNYNAITDFVKRIDKIANAVHYFIMHERAYGKSISILGASTKGNTILQYFNLDSKLIKYAADANESKWGLRTIGTDIEIQSDEFVFSKNPDYMLILPWFFVDNFIEKYKGYIEDGGTFIVPLPEPRLFSKKGWKNLNVRY